MNNHYCGLRILNFGAKSRQRDAAVDLMGAGAVKSWMKVQAGLSSPSKSLGSAQSRRLALSLAA